MHWRAPPDEFSITLDAGGGLSDQKLNTISRRRVDLFETREHTRERAAVRNVCVREYSEQAVISQSYTSPAHAKLDPLAHACMVRSNGDSAVQVASAGLDGEIRMPRLDAMI